MKAATSFPRRVLLLRPQAGAIPGRLALRQLTTQRSGQVGLALAALVLGFVVFGPIAVGGDPNAQDLLAPLQGPSVSHPFGTDEFGRDVLARFAAGGRRSLAGAVLVLGLTFAIGLVIGVGAGLVGGVLDAGLMRLADLFLGLPGLILAIAIVGALGPSFRNLIIALVAAAWPFYARVARGFTVDSAFRLDVIAARLAGVSRTRILFGHVLPGAASRLSILASFELGGVMLGLAGLSFLGLGAQPPASEWGAMMAQSRDYFTLAPWLLLAPGIGIAMVTTSANLIAECLKHDVMAS